MKLQSIEMHWHCCFLLLISYIAYGQAYVCLKTNIKINKAFCGAHSSIHTGDFDGNGKDDFVCHQNYYGHNTIHYAPRKPFESVKLNVGAWCGRGALFFVGDFNGDGRSDFLCHRLSDGYKWITYADKHGAINKRTDWKKPMRWCASRNGRRFFIGDFNGDKISDIFCHDRNGQMWVRYSSCAGGFPTGRDPRRRLKCAGKILMGDFNGDKKTDFLCHGSHGNKISVAFAGNPNNLFTKFHWSGLKMWCSHSHAYLTVGDVNGDGFDDLVCKDRSPSGNTWYVQNSRNLKNLFTHTKFHTKFCPSIGHSDFAIADVNGDKRGDFLCVSKKNFLHLKYSHCR